MDPLSRWPSVVILGTALMATLAAADICSKLKAGGIQVEEPFTLSYSIDLRRYWSAACGDLRPSCIVAPSSALEMSQVVKELHHFETLFAVKSGGHMPNNGFASIQDGLLISTKNLDQVLYSSDNQTAVIGPGLSWGNAQQGLRGTGRTLVGGRMAGVGVGGYMLGGGMSFLSSQYGWAANNIINFEVVLANGAIVNANKKANSDLFMSLKGGGNNFGIVTAYTLQTHPQDHEVWGGNYVFTSDKRPQILEALRDFVEYCPDDKAAIIVTVECAALLDTWIIFLFYDGPKPPQDVFDNFTAIGPLDITKTWNSYYDLLKHNDFFILPGKRYVIATETTPLPNKTVGAEMLQTYYHHWHNITKTVLNVPGMIGTLAFQPMPKAITSKAKARGGDLIDFPIDQDYIVIELDFSYELSKYDGNINAAIKSLFSGIDNITSNYIDNGILPNVYRPLFMNDANHAQDYWGRLRTTEQARRTRRRYDPEGFFQKRTSGGWRLE